MVLAKAPIAGMPWLLADWVEFQVLISEFNVYRLEEILRISDGNQEEENRNIAEQDARNEELLERVNQELDIRVNSLKKSYPFQFSSDGSELTRKSELTQGGHAYLYCLLFSHIKRTEVLIPDPPYTNTDRDLMQICSTLAAAGAVYGNAVSFGFPRDDNSGFLKALKKTYSRLGEGIPVDKVPKGAPDREKDASIDVIAWSENPDGGPGRYYLLGQVASGANWKGKSLKGDINTFHDTWFTRQMASQANCAMFIPFCLDVKPGESLHDVLHYKVIKYGRFFYRYVLPYYVDIGYQLVEDEANNFHIDRHDDFQKIPEYVQNFLQEISQA